MRKATKKIGTLAERQAKRRSERIVRQKIQCDLLLKYIGSPEILISIGIGHWLEGPSLLSAFPDCEFYGIEILERYIKSAYDSGYPGSILHAACWDKSGEELEFTDRLDRSSIFRTEAGGGGLALSVSTLTLDDMAKKLSIPKKDTFLWMDCEGCEDRVLGGGHAVLKNVKWILCELSENPDHNGWVRAKDVIEDLHDLGFNLIHKEKTDGVFIKK